MTQRDRRAALVLKAPSIRRFVAVAILIPALLVALVAWLGVQYRQSEQVRSQAARSFDRRIDQITLLSRLKDAETAQRGYLLTGDDAFLQPYEPARRDIGRLIAKLAGRDPEVPPAYRQTVNRLVTLKFAELDRTVALRRAGDQAAALRIVRDGGGNRLMDRLRSVIGEMIAREETRSLARRAAFSDDRERLQRMVYAIVGVLVAILLVFLGVLWSLRRQRHALLVETFEAAERHATILDSTIDAILILNPSGTVETMNAAATRMLGYAPAEITRRDVAIVLDLARGEGSFHRRIGLIDGQLRQSFLPGRAVRHRDGREIAVDVAIGVMSLPSGDHLVVSLRDISERKRMERVKDDLMSTVSHELRTPLTSVVGSLGLLRAGVAGALPVEAARLVDIAENNSRRLIRLINDMLDIDRIESGMLEVILAPLDLGDVIDQACVGGDGLARANDVTLECTRIDRPVIVAGDADRLVQVVANLLSNAIRFAPPGSTVALGYRVQDGRAVVSVEDRGAGVPTAFRDRIFGRFERADRDDAATGTGLGLAISREIVTRHNGAIWFEDRAGGGTRFAFSLPLVGGAVDRDDAAPVVLVCEADDEVARGLVASVAAEGCGHERVRSAEDAQAALDRRSFAAVLVGLGLPPAGALPLVQRLRDDDATPRVPVIMVATAGRDQAPSWALDVVDWIAKPADPERLSLALRTALARGGTRRPVILHLDDDRDLLEVVAAAIEPEARIVAATDLASARAILRTVSPDVAILDVRLADGSGLDLLSSLVDADGVAIPTIIYSAQELTGDVSAQVDAVLIKARGSIPDLKATIRRIVRPKLASEAG